MCIVEFKTISLKKKSSLGVEGEVNLLKKQKKKTHFQKYGVKTVWKFMEPRGNLCYYY